MLIYSNKNNAKTREEKNETVDDLFSIKKAPDAIWHYSKAYYAWDLLFCSWQIALNPETMEMIKWSIEDETKQICRNISNLLEEYWLELKDVVKITIFLKDISYLEKVNNIYKNYFILKPARSTIEVSNLPKWASVKIEVIASK